MAWFIYLCNNYKLQNAVYHISIMKKFILFTIISTLSAINSMASDSLSLVQDSVKLSTDSLKEVVDTLEVSVAVPTLEWDKHYSKTPKVKADYLFAPLVFEEYTAIGESKSVEADQNVMPSLSFDINDIWLKSSLANNQKVRGMRYNAMIYAPQNVQYNQKDLPVPPKTYVIAPNPTNRMVTIEEKKYTNLEKAQAGAVKVRNWIHSFNSSIQLSQAYLSENWYQGGENNINVLGNFVWNVKLNNNIHKKLLFENSVQYKVSINSAPQDTIRGYSISQDLFQVNTKFGYKAIKKWYYSATLRFKTQLLNNYASNTNNMKTSILSPAELNVGLGMTYSTTSKKNALKFDMSISPLSMDMNICREIKKIDPTSFGIDEGKHFKAAYGSNLEAKMTWKICDEVTWSSRLFAFTNYERVQSDWENTLNFSINKYLSTKLYAHLRYDDSVTKDPSWKYWQFNEVLSFGFNYTFSM